LRIGSVRVRGGTARVRKLRKIATVDTKGRGGALSKVY
jgi:hypothetical protein